MMRKLLLVAPAAMVITAPAAARDGLGYVGIGGGVLFPRPQTGDAQVVYTTTESGTPAPGPATFTFEKAYDRPYRPGIDVDAVAGYDFGMFRLEAELAWKRAKPKKGDVNAAFLTKLNADLNRPPADFTFTSPPLAALIAADFDISRRMNIISTMANALVDTAPGRGVSLYGGAGFGRSWARSQANKDSAWAGQLIAGARYSVSPKIEVGLKYRYFRTGRLEFSDDAGVEIQGNATRYVDAFGVFVRGGSRVTNAALFDNFKTRFSSHSLLASLTFNFGSSADPLPLTSDSERPSSYSEMSGS